MEMKRQCCICHKTDEEIGELYEHHLIPKYLELAPDHDIYGRILLCASHHTLLQDRIDQRIIDYKKKAFNVPNVPIEQFIYMETIYLLVEMTENG